MREYEGDISMIEDFCKQNGCESDPKKCGYYPRDCMIVSLRRSLDDLIYICESYDITDGAPKRVSDDINKAIKIAKLASEVQ
jgi:hypothetical protein